jgi:hypothetical protein
MTGLLLFIFAVAFLLSYTLGSSPLAVLLFLFTLVCGFFLWRLRVYLGSPSVLLAPTAGTVFAEHAPRGQQGEILVSYKVYNTLHRRFLLSATSLCALGIMVLLNSKSQLVPGSWVLGPIALGVVMSMFIALFSLLKLVPLGSRAAVVHQLFVADPRLAFARYAERQASGSFAMSYKRYKLVYRATITAFVVLIILIIVGVVAYAQ